MSCYETPRRRHCSLFQRMQKQIKKITKKISAAKDSTFQSKSNHFTSHNSILQRNPLTTRKKLQQSNQSTQLMGSSQPILLRKPASRKTIQLNRPLQITNTNRIIIRLQNQNQLLTQRLKQMQSLCSSQSYEIGYMRAELNKTSQQLAIQKQKELKQTCYLSTILQHYKKKANKYKKILKQNNFID